MSSLNDYRIELLLLIPGIWMLIQLFPVSNGGILNREIETGAHWDISKVKVLPAYQSQKEVLLSVFQLEKIPVNRADAEILETVPGIGPVLAKRIVDDRNSSGFYHQPADLARVRGIGTKRVEQFHSFLSFD